MCSAASSAGCRCTRSRLPGWCWQQLQTPRSAQGLQVPKSNAGRRGPGSGGLLVSLCCDLAFCFCRVEGVFEARLQLRQGGGLRQLLPSGLQRHWRTGFLTSVTCHCKANISDVVPGGIWRWHTANGVDGSSRTRGGHPTDAGAGGEGPPLYRQRRRRRARELGGAKGCRRGVGFGCRKRPRYRTALLWSRRRTPGLVRRAVLVCASTSGVELVV